MISLWFVRNLQEIQSNNEQQKKSVKWLETKESRTHKRKNEDSPKRLNAPGLNALISQSLAIPPHKFWVSGTENCIIEWIMLILSSKHVLLRWLQISWFFKSEDSDILIKQCFCSFFFVDLSRTYDRFFVALPMIWRIWPNPFYSLLNFSFFDSKFLIGWLNFFSK